MNFKIKDADLEVSVIKVYDNVMLLLFNAQCFIIVTHDLTAVIEFVSNYFQ